MWLLNKEYDAATASIATCMQSRAKFPNSPQTSFTGEDRMVIPGLLLSLVSKPPAKLSAAAVTVNSLKL